MSKKSNPTFQCWVECHRSHVDLSSLHGARAILRPQRHFRKFLNDTLYRLLCPTHGTHFDKWRLIRRRISWQIVWYASRSNRVSFGGVSVKKHGRTCTQYADFLNYIYLKVEFELLIPKFLIDDPELTDYSLQNCEQLGQEFSQFFSHFCSNLPIGTFWHRHFPGWCKPEIVSIQFYDSGTPHTKLSAL